MLAIIAHGGAGTWRAGELDEARNGLEAAARAGYALLLGEKASIDACQAAIEVLEGHPRFNAGTGSVLNLEGQVEMDAGLMRSDGASGAVAGVRDIRHPIALARKVMEDTERVLVAGEGAQRLAGAYGPARYDPVTQRSKERWERQRREFASGGAPAKLRAFLDAHPEYERGTVGCVALDRSGLITVWVSTGGVALKLPGRVGDSPLAGAGFYALPAGGVAATGQGEDIIRAVLSYRVAALMEAGREPRDAAESILKREGSRLRAGLIALSAAGRFGMATNTEHLPVAYWAEGMTAPAFRAR